jgi:hypothetical protein
MSDSRVSPVKFAESWATTVPVTVPVKGQVGYARSALSAHASSLYENPLSRGLKARERDRYVRAQLKTYHILLESKGFIQTTLDFKDTAHAFLESLSASNGRMFYTQHSSIVGTPMELASRTLVGRDLNNAADIQTIQFIYEWLVYLSKMPLERPDLLGPAETAWIERQESPRAFTASQDVIEEVRRIVSFLYEPTFTLVGNHGPGSTANGAKTVPEKNADYKPTIQSMELTRFHVDNIQYGKHLIRQCVWTAVFKDVGSLRPITMEPVETQYAQQGAKFDIYSQIDDPDSTHPISHFIRFSDQQPSRNAALRGSLISSYRYKPSTIDLKNASDRVLVDVVVALFTGNFLHVLLAGRSWRCRIGKKRSIELAMYGGMGSALTFPVQSIIFCALAIYAALKEHYKVEYGVEGSIDDLFEVYMCGDELRKKYRYIWDNIRIYGDDIAIPDYAAERLIKLLSDFGLEVNTRKSFVGASPVRESCGVYAVAGTDITPRRYRIPDSGQVMDGAKYEATRSAANDAFLCGKRIMYKTFVRSMTNADFFMSSKEQRRKFQRSKLYPGEKFPLGRPQIVFEAFNGQDKPSDVVVGLLSSRPTVPTENVRTHEKVRACTTYFVESVSEKDLLSEYYHLTINYRQMCVKDRDSIEDHGSIPKGTRLKLRIATLSTPSRRGRFMDWGWAPS